MARTLERDEHPPELAKLLKPDLYALEDDGNVILKGARCRCGYTFFPPQHYGCEKCGSTGAAPATLRGRGKLVASAMVHIHSRPGREAPFVIGTIKLVDGPVVRALLAGSLDGLCPGTAMTAILTSISSEDGKERLDLRFATDPGASIRCP
jgi:uncharacterized OB-fold protein